MTKETPRRRRLPPVEAEEMLNPASGNVLLGGLSEGMCLESNLCVSFAYTGQIHATFFLNFPIEFLEDLFRIKMAL